MKVEISEDLKTLTGNESVYLKNDCFYIAELNYYTIMKMLKLINNDLYNDLLFNKELTRCAIISILHENKEASPLEIIEYISSQRATNIFTIGNEYRIYFNEYLTQNSFQLDKFKALVYSDDNLDIFSIFRNFPNLKALYVYDAEHEELKVYNRKGQVIKKKKIDESEVNIEFDKLKESQIKEDESSYINKLIREIIDKFFNLREFFADFEEEIINRLLSLVGIVDLEEETFKKLKKLEEENSLSSKLQNALSKKLKEKQKTMKKKYGVEIK